MTSADAAHKNPDIVLRLFVVRHGETLSNIEGKVAGQAESPLTDLGEKQAIALGKSGRIQFPKFWRLYASDLKRTQKTAKLIQQGAMADVGSDSCPLEGQDYILEKRIRELSKGARQGFLKTLSTEEAVEERRKQAEKAGRTLKEEDIPLLESEQDGYARFSDWLFELLRDAIKEYNNKHRKKEKNASNEPHQLLALVVSHSALIRSVLTSMFSREELDAQGAVFDSPSHLLVPNTSLTMLEITPNLESSLWNRETPPSASEFKSVFKARLVELTWTGHYDQIS